MLAYADMTIRGGVGGLPLGERERRNLGPSASLGTLAVETGDGSEGDPSSSKCPKMKNNANFCQNVII